MHDMALKLPWYFYLLIVKPVVATSKFVLLVIRQHSAASTFLYSEGDRSGLRKPKKDKHQH